MYISVGAASNHAYQKVSFYFCASAQIEPSKRNYLFMSETTLTSSVNNNERQIIQSMGVRDILDTTFSLYRKQFMLFIERNRDRCSEHRWSLSQTIYAVYRDCMYILFGNSHRIFAKRIYR